MNPPKLTSEEIKIVELILEFFKNSDIASELNYAAHETNEKIVKVLELFDCRTKTELIMKCGRESLHFLNEDGIGEQRLYFIGSGTDSH